MNFIKNYNLNYFFKIFSIRQHFFLLGIFFLPSVLPVEQFLLISIFISFSENKENLLKQI